LSDSTLDEIKERWVQPPPYPNQASRDVQFLLTTIDHLLHPGQGEQVTMQARIETLRTTLESASAENTRLRGEIAALESVADTCCGCPPETVHHPTLHAQLDESRGIVQRVEQYATRCAIMRVEPSTSGLRRALRGDGS